MEAGTQIGLSVMALGAGVWLFGKSTQRLAHILFILVTVILSAALYGLYLISDYFTGDGINEAVLYHLTYGLEGAGFSEYTGIYAASAAVILILILVLFCLLRRPWQRAHPTPPQLPRNILAASCVILSFAINPATLEIYNLLSLRSGGNSILRPEKNNNIEENLQAEFNEYYSLPKLKQSVDNPRNIVFIYAESLERTYFDTNIFPGLMTRLSDLESEAISFTDIVQVDGTGWTIAGMVASQCGIPLLTPSHGNAMGGIKTFLPGATCLGDLLSQENYQLAFIGGAKLIFAGKGNFYRTHKFDTVEGLDELRDKVFDRSSFNDWGLSDDALLDLAFKKYTELAQQRKKFGMFLLTLDTHHPNGHLSKKCTDQIYRDGNNPILNSVLCADLMLSDFINRIRKSPWGKETVIVLASDHLAMRNSAFESLTARPRKNLFMVWSPENSRGKKINTTGSTLDTGTTVLPFMGFQGKIGLGNNLLAMDEQLMARANFVRKNMVHWHAPLINFWGFPKIEKSLEINVTSRQVVIDGTRMRFPVMIELDNDLKTTVKFLYMTSVKEVVQRNHPANNFLLIAECVAKDPTLPSDQICLFAGNGNQFRNQVIVRNDISFSPNQIRRLIGQ